MPDYGESDNKTIAAYRERFKTAPVGRWRQAVGTFAAVMDELWEFRPDNTGRIVTTGPFGGTRDETLFAWKEVAPLAVACMVTQWPDEDGSTDDLEMEQDFSDPWSIIHYDFEPLSTDSADVVAMRQVTTDGTLLKGFWLSMEPLVSTDTL